MTDQRLKSISFQQIVADSARFNRDEFVTDFGGLVADVSDMLQSPIAQSAVIHAREWIEQCGSETIAGVPRLQTLRFGIVQDAPELLSGNVAAIDGTPVLPLQKYSSGQALCVGIGSRSYTRPMDEALHGYTSKVTLGDLRAGAPEDIREFFRRVQEGIYTISQTAYMRFFEAKHALEIAEPFVFTDGTLLYEWLINQDQGRALYKDLLANKKAIGVMKSLKESLYLSWLGRALHSGEVFIYETVYDHVTDTSRVPRRDAAEQAQLDAQWERDAEFVALAQKVYRGVFKPVNKAFGFECHIDHLPTMLRIMAADCQLNLPGHEIPFLLNDIDREVKGFFKTNLVKTRIGQRLSQDGENLFFDEGDEHDFR